MIIGSVWLTRERADRGEGFGRGFRSSGTWIKFFEALDEMRIFFGHSCMIAEWNRWGKWGMRRKRLGFKAWPFGGDEQLIGVFAEMFEFLPDGFGDKRHKGVEKFENIEIGMPED